MRWYHKLVGLGFGLVTLYALAHALYLGWCWGWWDSQNSPWSWIMDCQCPRASEHARVQLKYGLSAFVLVPSCMAEDEKKAALTKLVQEGNAGSWWLTENWSLLAKDASNQSEYTLLNLKDGRQVPLQKLDILTGNKFAPQTLQILRSAGRVLIPESGLAIILPPEFDETPTVAWFIEERDNRLDVSQILYKNRILTEHTKQVLFSKNRRFYYFDKEIYLTATDQPVARLTNYAGFYSPRVWLKDDTGPILESFASTMTVFPNDPRPILLVQVPREYLTPEHQSAFDARQQELEQIRGEGNRQVGWALGLALLVTSATTAWWLYWGWFKRRACTTF